MKKTIITSTLATASLILMLFVSACSSSSNGGSNGNAGTPIVTSDGKITTDTLVTFIQHYGKLNVCKRELRREITINDTSKIKKLLGGYYPNFLDKITNRILIVPYDIYVSISFDLGEITSSIREDGSGVFFASKPTPIVDVTGIYIRFDEEYRDIGTIRLDITDAEFSAAWRSENVPDLIKQQIADRKDEFLDAAVLEAVSSILNSVRNRYRNIEFKFESTEKAPTFNEIPNPIIERK